MLFIGILALLGAIILSVVSALFSINGIQTIFSGAVLWATIMAGAMEFAKIASTVWIYRFWKKTKMLLKSYIVVAILILIIISSIGIFGFLSKAYVGQAKDSLQVENKIERLKLSIQTEERNIVRANENLDLLDDAIQSYIDLNAITKGLDRREEQQEERRALLEEIRDSENRISKIQDEIFELQNQQENLQVNVGPIKYISILLYGEENAEDNYDNAARIFIILLVVVFDPFAVLLMVAGNISITSWQEKKKDNQNEEKNIEKIIQEAKKEGRQIERDKHIKKKYPTRMGSINPTITRKKEMEGKAHENYDPTKEFLK